MAKVIYAPVADEDLYSIAEFISRDNPGAAIKWIKKLQETCELLAENPELGEKPIEFGVPDCRLFSVGNYVIFYRSISEGIEVARIVHGKRDLKNL